MAVGRDAADRERAKNYEVSLPNDCVHLRPAKRNVVCRKTVMPARQVQRFVSRAPHPNSEGEQSPMGVISVAGRSAQRANYRTGLIAHTLRPVAAHGFQDRSLFQ